MVKPDELFLYEREPDPKWQADLNRIAPPGDRVNWLKIHWFPGEPYEPIQRWAVWEIVVNPLQHVKTPDEAQFVKDVLADLNGPDPKTDGRWFYDEDLGQDRWFSNSNVSQVQQKIYHEIGGGQKIPHLTWIIQGSNGGHLWKLGPADRAVLAEFRADADQVDTPLPGDLPYADYDERVSSRLAERDRLRRWKQGLGWDDRGYTKTAAGLYVRQDRHEAEKQYRLGLMKWLDAQIEDAFQDVSRSSLPGPSDFQGSKPKRVDLDELEREFVEDTGTLVTSEA